MGQVAGEVVQPLGQRRDGGVEAQEDEALPGLGPDGRQAEGLEAEVLEVLGVLGPDEPPVEVVDPGVVGALEADGLAALPLLHRGAPVAAHVVEGADHVVAAADQDDGLAHHRLQPERAGLREVLLARDQEPVAAEPVLLLEVEDRLVLVAAARQQRRAAVRAADGGELVWRQDRHLASPAAARSGRAMSGIMPDAPTRQGAGRARRAEGGRTAPRADPRTAIRRRARGSTPRRRSASTEA